MSARSAALRLVSIAIAAVVAASVLVTWLASAPSSKNAPSALDTTPASRALDAVSKAWSDELDDLAVSTRALAIADDTYEFIVRPNLPYVHDHYTREQLLANRIDTVLIIDVKRNPRLWRRVNDRHNRGFPDAKAFLAELPKLSVPSEPGVPALSGAVRLPRGPTLVVAVPIYPASGTGPPRGWLIAGRTLNSEHWRRYGEAAGVAVEALEPYTREWPTEAVPVPGKAPTAVLRVDANSIHGWLPVYDIKGERLRLFSVALASPAVPVASVAPLPNRSSLYGRWLASSLAVLIGVLLFMLRGRVRLVVSRLAAPHRVATETRSDAAPAVAPIAPTRGVVDEQTHAVADACAATAEERFENPEFDTMFEPTELASSKARPYAERARDAGESTSAASMAATAEESAGRLQDPARERLATASYMFRYQPQVDLQSGQITGVEALLYHAGDAQEQRATGVGAEAQAAGLTLEVTERWLREACCERHAWSREVDRDFPVGVPVPLHTLEDPAFIPLLRRILADSGLPPALLELEAPEEAFTSSPTALRALEQARAAGVLISVDGFGRGVSSLRSLAVIQIAKLRIDAALVRESAYDLNAATFVHAIVGAARELRVAVCATGVDSDGQVATLTAHGRLFAQGLALAPSVEGEQLLAALHHTGAVTTQVPGLEQRDAVRTDRGPAPDSPAGPAHAQGIQREPYYSPTSRPAR